MRPGQQNKRPRGRGSNNSNNNNNNNRKGANPLTRSYDSSGPDVKVRGTAQNIAEKYLTLARDSQGAGDRVMAENYFQHAEHYIRIIATAQAQQQERFQREERPENQDGAEAAAPRANSQAAPDERVDRNDRREQTHQRRPEPIVDADGPQPVIEGTPAEVAAETSDGQPVSRPRNPRRHTAASPRPRRTKRAAVGENVEDLAAVPITTDVAAVAATPDAPVVETVPDVEPVPKKPVRRRRAPKAENNKQSEPSEVKPNLADVSQE